MYQELMEAYETKLEDTQEEVQKLKKAKEELNINFEEIRKQVEEDTDFEIQQTKAGCVVNSYIWTPNYIYSETPWTFSFNLKNLET